MRLVVLLSTICVCSGRNKPTNSAALKAKSPPPPTTSRLGENSVGASANAPNGTPDGVVQLVETELFDGKAWKAPGGAKKSTSLRWTDFETGEAAPSPTDYQEDAFDWTSEWKIVTSAQRDEYGWEYDFKKNRSQLRYGLSSAPLRRRLWLRTYKEDAPELPSSTSSSRSVRRRKGKRRLGPATQAFQMVLEDFNFKGFGVSFYKSLVFLKSAGIALRLPLLTNFNTWESHPSLPSLATSIAFYTPGTLVVFLNASIRYEWLQWVVKNTASTLAYTCVWLVWTLLLRGLITALSALVFPFTRKLLLDPKLPLQPPDWRIPPTFSRFFEERLGCSWSWRVSIERGYEHRVSYWHYFAPSVAALLRGWKGTPDFLVRHAAAIGLSTSGPIPDEPFLTSNLLFAMSGFHFKKSPPIRAATTETAPFIMATKGAFHEQIDDDIPEAHDTRAANASQLLRL